MDDSSFEASAMAPILETSRRRLLGGLVGGTLAGVFSRRETEANSKRSNKRHNKSQERGRDQGGDARRREGPSKVEGGSKQNGGSPALKVLTRNLYLGAD